MSIAFTASRADGEDLAFPQASWSNASLFFISAHELGFIPVGHVLIYAMHVYALASPSSGRTGGKHLRSR